MIAEVERKKRIHIRLLSNCNRLRFVQGV